MWDIFWPEANVLASKNTFITCQGIPNFKEVLKLGRAILD
jgi:hypothetical protein